MKIVITGITSFRNRGVEALVTTTIEQLRQRLPGAEYLVLDRMPEYDSSRIDSPDVKFKLDETVRPLYSSRLRRTLLQLSDHVEALGREYQATIRDVQNASAVVASGGDVFCSEYGHQSLLSHLAPLKVARAAKVPFFIHAQSIGPFKNDLDARTFVAVARSAAHITVRERMSFDYVTRKLGLSEKQVTLTADPAFLLKRNEAAWREHYGIGQRKPMVALSTSQAICNWMGSDYGNHFRVWCDVVGWLLNELKAAVVLIPHVQEISTKNDDRILATHLMRHFQFHPSLQIAGGDFSASDYKGIISRCDLVVAERMHAAIAGLSSGVPTVVIGYSVKGEGILTDLLGAETVKRSVLISLKEFLDGRTPLERIARAWKDRADLKTRVEEQLPETQRLAAASFDIIAAHLGAAHQATR